MSAVAACQLCGPSAINPPAWSRSQLEASETVVRVVDGDTVILKDSGRVRLIGVDCPESVAPDVAPEAYGTEAADFTRRRLTGKTVRLEFDGERRDRHNRLLAYLYLSDGELFNLTLIREGFGYAYTLQPFRFATDFLRAEDEARKEQRGMWAKTTNRSVAADLHGNIRSRFYHAPHCENYSCPNCTEALPSREEAESRGFRPHWGCIASRAEH